MNTYGPAGRTWNRREQLRFRRNLVVASVVAIAALFTAIPVAVTNQSANAADGSVFTDGLAPGWSSSSWRAAVEVASNTTVYSGSRSISAQVTQIGGALSLQTGAPVPMPADAELRFVVHGGARGVNLQVYTGSDAVFSTISNVVTISAPAGVWTPVILSAAQLGQPGTIGRIMVSGPGGSVTDLFFLDDINVAGTSAPPPTTAPPTTVPPTFPPPPTTVPPTFPPPPTTGPPTTTTTTITTTPPEPSSGSIVIDPSVSRPFDQRLRGSNVSYFSTPELLANKTLRARTSGVSSLLRFPGGQDSQRLGWASCQLQVDLPLATPCGTASNRSRTSDFLAFVQATGAEAVITLNINATAKENAAYVAFANGLVGDTRVIGVDQRGADWKTVGYWAEQRARAGLAGPIGVRLWEFGNETYGGLAGGSKCVSYGWEVTYSCDPVDYLNGAGSGRDRFDGYTATREAMLAVDRQIQVGAPAVDPKEGYNDWTENLLRLGSAQIDFLELHHYSYWIPPANDDAGNREILASPRTQLSALSARMNTLFDRESRGRRIPILLSEFNLTPAPRNDPAQRISSVLNAMVQTELIGTMGELGGFLGANHFDLVGEAPWRETYFATIRNDGRFTRSPEYWGAVMWSKFGSHMVTNFSTFDSLRELTVLSGRRPDGSTTLLVLNKTNAAARADIRFQSAAPMQSVTVDVAAGESLAARTMSFNGVADPSDDLSNAPGRSLPVGGAQVFAHTFPPASITLLTIR
jgi:hypothetical protein